jgi:hypothetical protein
VCDGSGCTFCQLNRPFECLNLVTLESIINRVCANCLKCLSQTSKLGTGRLKSVYLVQSCVYLDSRSLKMKAVTPFRGNWLGKSAR